MASIKFKLRTSIKLGKQASLYIQLIHQRRVKTITLPYKLYSHEWEPLNEEIILQSDNIRFNYLKEVQTTFFHTIITVRVAISSPLCKNKSRNCSNEEKIIRHEIIKPPYVHFNLFVNGRKFTSRI